ncbi:circularly permuted type 2 ATP-grasp protein [Pseudoroseomonas cervicalis]|uniref:circularly permuted type 2 ATP-grasp protein n=1 Tax=Teichococcus cervicalis TaxID=204525 RepID=UPI0022F16FE2|nr:circularly permuted type 2 ATP-grasp protein [Pseudoroseomonas cervicalis]WBV42126.1 circularly permuted type 2 ATP-grasp protein [Pseudoroseomonas cervicalis]
MNSLAPVDEMVDGRGQVRPHWRGILAAFADLPPEHAGSGTAEAARRLDRAFEDEGISSLLPGAGRAARAWRCDPVPLVLPAAEFAELAEGLAQRARLLDAILADCYGPQRLLAERLLPPALVFANPAFLRPARSAAHPPLQPLLHAYAADLIRGPDGRWHLLADRTSRAAGIGHAQENRRMLGRVLPQLFRFQQVRPLRPFFDRWQDSLQRLAPSGRDNAAIALLTPGVHHPLWFEHVLLAGELSCALVEPGDLTVRGGALWLKTLKGLRPVDVLLRRVDGRSLDPLEFGGHGPGVPGMMDAMRHGALRIVNAPGCGMVEAPALAPYLPALCRRLLGEALRLPALETHWLAEPGARAALLADPAAWMVRHAHDGAQPAQPLAGMGDAALAALLARIRERPQDFAASRALPPSVAPCADGPRLSPAPVILRMFLVQDGGEWHALPGGLARLPEAATGLGGRLPRQGVAKDVWVLSEEGTQILGPAALPAPPLTIQRGAGELPSRVADNLFWLGRYVERLEGSARLMRAVLGRLDRGPLLPREQAELSALAAALHHAGLAQKEDAPNGAANTALQAALWRALREDGTLGWLMAEIARLVESVRDRLTGDMHTLFTLPLRAVRVQASAPGRGLQGLEEVLAGILRYSAGVAGAAAENMVRAGGYAFLDLGRRLERAQAIAAQLGFALAQPASRIEGGLRLALELCDSVITYRSRYLGVLQPAPALDLVLADPGNPRGLAYQLQAMRRRLVELDGGAEEALLPGLDALMAAVEAIPRQLLAAADQAPLAAQLAPRLAAMEGEIAALSDGIARRYFALLPPAQTLGQDVPEQPAVLFWGAA